MMHPAPFLHDLCTPMLGSGAAEPAECQPHGPDLAAADASDLRRAVLAHLHMHAYEFSVAPCADGERLPERYGNLQSIFMIVPTT